MEQGDTSRKAREYRLEASARHDTSRIYSQVLSCRSDVYRVDEIFQGSALAEHLKRTAIEIARFSGQDIILTLKIRAEEQK